MHACVHMCYVCVCAHEYFPPHIHKFYHECVGIFWREPAKVMPEVHQLVQEGQCVHQR